MDTDADRQENVLLERISSRDDLNKLVIWKAMFNILKPSVIQTSSAKNAYKYIRPKGYGYIQLESKWYGIKIFGKVIIVKILINT
ncbi:hypothetical protein A7K50_09935 [Dehalobacter sp. MCB1]|nr:hypothetical protein A7K50_09935 [Dehalobacter sp. MCB1]TCX53432.1 hypothetical protein C1I36_01365 [Dehalobacter sp. 14DCB1]TCX54781.1 hypothetical protein C1I38_03580 [Dehalobacter sp. 12DCB1]